MIIPTKNEYYITLDNIVRAVRLRNEICGKHSFCPTCPLRNVTCRLFEARNGEELLETLRAIWEEERKRTVYIPDEIVNEVTFEATYVDKAGVLLSEEGKAERMQLLEELVKPALANADSVRCVKIQQFVTKGHEEEC